MPLLGYCPPAWEPVLRSMLGPKRPQSSQMPWYHLPGYRALKGKGSHASHPFPSCWICYYFALSIKTIYTEPKKKKRKKSCTCRLESMLSHITARTPCRKRQGQAKREDRRKEKTLAFYGSTGCLENLQNI